MWCLKRIRWDGGHLNRAAAQHALDSWTVALISTIPWF